MDHLKRIVAAIAIIGWSALPLAQAKAQSKFTAGLSWANEAGSVLSITSVGPNGLLSGTFTTKVGCGHGKPHPVTGWFYPAANGGAVTFSVYWNGCNSVTSWLGQFNNTTNHFQALWHLSVASAPVWNGIVAGSDIFTRTAAGRKP
jgi:hypothetical protein